jgi:exonuclease SbcC
MIPLHLTISGFLSYRDPVDLDLSGFHLACISGANGAGKSSMLDAITWALFGVARKRDESVINMQSNAAEVSFSFAYEGNEYRVQRSLRQGKPTVLEFHIRAENSPGEPGPGPWRALTEKGVRETQGRIEQTLRMDYETFVNASFFLQGKADQFTQQRPGDRKRILGSILGLDAWEAYRERAAGQRKLVESTISGLDGRLADIQSELSEEAARTSHLKELQQELERLSKSRKAQEKALEAIRKVAATLAEQQRLVEVMQRQVDQNNRRLEDTRSRAAMLEAERQGYAALIERGAEIESGLRAWQELRQELAGWDETAARFHEHEARRQAPLLEIEAARAGLEQERRGLLDAQATIESQQATLQALVTSAGQSEAALAQYEISLQQRAELQTKMESARQAQAEARAENPRLREEMNVLNERIAQLQKVEGAACPVCGQPLAEADRLAMVDALNVQGKEMGDRFRSNQAYLKDAEQLIADLNQHLGALASLEGERLAQTQSLAQLRARIEQIEVQKANWEKVSAPRLREVTASLEQGSYALEARQALAQVDAELKAIGYDAAAHDAARQAELQKRSVENEFNALEKAHAALAPLESELANLQSQAASLESETARQQTEVDEAIAALAAAQAQAPDVEAAEFELFSSQERENRLRLEVGAARQKVLVLDDLKTRRDELTGQREAQARLVGQYKQLERAFSKDGVPALLIEQALPQIEAKANELLDRLSGGGMSVRFATQAAFKDKKRDDLRETLDIMISDSAGTRDYELYSGGEAFRVNFAIRLALSEVLAQRAGARLQTLVIDEGFGSQDAQGRQRLIEAINMVEPDFAKILVITHIEELKEAFPTRIEVEKGERGSTIRILQ